MKALSKLCGWLLLAVTLSCHSAFGLAFLHDSSTTVNTTQPSGAPGVAWAAQIPYLSGSLQINAVPISDRYFLSPHNAGLNTSFTFTESDGTTFTRTVKSVTRITGTDFSVGKILDTDEPFHVPTPIYWSTDPADLVGRNITVYGRGFPKNSTQYIFANGGTSGLVKGWKVATSGRALRWGTGQITERTYYGGLGVCLVWAFSINDPNAFACMMTANDSGAGVYVEDEDGVYRLAGIGVSSQTNIKYTSGGTNFKGVTYDAGTLYLNNVLVTEDVPNYSVDQAASSYAVAIAAYRTQIEAITGTLP